MVISHSQISNFARDGQPRILSDSCHRRATVRTTQLFHRRSDSDSVLGTILVPRVGSPPRESNG